MTLNEYVILNVSSEKYYESRFPNWNSKYRLNVYCPWHEQAGKNSPSLSVGLRNGGAKCHGCGKVAGNIIHFESLLKEIGEVEAGKSLYIEFIRPFFSSDQVKKFANNLQFNPVALDKLVSNTGIGLKTARHFNLGWDFKSNRIIIPVKTRFNNSYGNVRFYRLPSDRSDKDLSPKIYNAKGYGYAELYPWEQIKTYTPDQPLIWMKAERDTLLGIQGRLQAFCITGSGETVGLKEWIDDFRDFEIYIVGDNDKEGKKHSQKRLEEIQDNCKFAKIVNLPFSSKTKLLKDYSDWILFDEGSAKKLLDQIDATKNHIEDVVKEPELLTQRFLTLSSIKNNPDIRNVKVRTKGIIVGKLDVSYSIPYKFNVISSDSPIKICEIPISRELISLVRQSDSAVDKFVKEIILKNTKCKIEPTDYVSATEVAICPVVDLTSVGSYLEYSGIFIGNNVETNVPYELEVIPTSSMHTQAQIGIVTSANPLSSILDTELFQEGVIKQLEVFKPEGDCWEGLCNFANEISLSYTRIYNRLDWHIIALLTYLCPLHFKFPYEGIQRGWINSLVLGDTQTGKSQVAHSLQQLFNCGAIVNAENCTFVGLVGGTVKNSSGQFMLRWGRIPINDRQLVVVEELSGLTTAEISRMSEVRSSGIARIDKGGITAETTGRTRLLILSNVRGSGKALGSYSNGLRAVSELVGQAEDVSRFDMICTLTDSEVSSKIINQRATDYTDSATYSQEELQKLVRFIWSLKPDQIKLTEKAYLASLQITQRMAEQYHPSIPIFKAGSGRLKLARIACAIACLQFNWNGNQIIVHEDHIKCAQQVLEMLYNKESFGYGQYSKKQFSRDVISDESSLDKVFKDTFHKRDKRQRVLRYIEMNGRFSEIELATIAIIPGMDINKFIACAIDSNIIERVGKEWAMTSVGKIWLDKNLKE